MEAVGGESVVRQLAEEHSIAVDASQLAFLEKFASLVHAADRRPAASHAATVREALSHLDVLRAEVREELSSAVKGLGARRHEVTAWDVEESIGGLPLVAVQVDGVPLLVVRVTGEYAERKGAGVSYGLKVGCSSVNGFAGQAMQRLEVYVKKKARVVAVGDLVTQWVAAVAEFRPKQPGADATME